MTELSIWLKHATRSLSEDSAVQVRREIQDHYESAREASINAGATDEEASQSAMIALGDAQTANCQYRKVLPTSAEIRVLRQGNCEARAISSRPWLKWLLVAMPVAALLAAALLFLNGAAGAARILLSAGGAVTIFFEAPFLLPVYTPVRGRIYRAVKWMVLIAILALAFGPDLRKSSWLLISCIWPMFWIEWTRSSIRRKLPVSQWPRQLYL